MDKTYGLGRVPWLLQPVTGFWGADHDHPRSHSATPRISTYRLLFSQPNVCNYASPRQGPDRGLYLCYTFVEHVLSSYVFLLDLNERLGPLTLPVSPLRTSGALGPRVDRAQRRGPGTAWDGGREGGGIGASKPPLENRSRRPSCWQDIPGEPWMILMYIYLI